MSAMPSMKKKILLMGRSGCGKTSMRALVFSSAIYSNPASTQRLGPTTGMELSTFRFLKNLLINLFDCGGQQTYMDSYVEDKREQVFKDVGAFVYVFDMGSANNEEGEDGWQGDLRYWRDCLKILRQLSPNAHVVCLLHKMDLLNSARRQDIYTDRVKDLRGKAKELGATELSCYGTSIWDETLYRAWSRIIHALIPNIATLESNLTEFTKITAATEAVIFEKTTFLVIARSGGDTVAKSVGSAADKAKASAGPGSSPSSKRTATANRLSTVSSHGTLSDDKERDLLLEGYPPTEAERKALLARGEMHPERFEKISELVKNLRGSCNKLQASFEAFEVRGATFSAYLDVFTENTYIMVIVADPRVELSAIKLNVQLGRERFEKLG